MVGILLCSYVVNVIKPKLSIFQQRKSYIKRNNNKNYIPTTQKNEKKKINRYFAEEGICVKELYMENKG